MVHHLQVSIKLILICLCHFAYEIYEIFMRNINHLLIFLVMVYQLICWSFFKCLSHISLKLIHNFNFLENKWSTYILLLINYISNMDQTLFKHDLNIFEDRLNRIQILSNLSLNMFDRYSNHIIHTKFILC